MSILTPDQSARYIDSLTVSVQALEADLAAERAKRHAAETERDEYKAAEQKSRAYLTGLERDAQADLAATRDNARMWELAAQQMANDREFYQRIVREAGKHFGVAACTSDDGSLQEDVLALKVPELVAQAQARIAALEQAARMARETVLDFFGDPEECEDCADLGEARDPRDLCRLHGPAGTPLYRCVVTLEALLGQCQCGHGVGEHREEDYRSCKHCACRSFRLPAQADARGREEER